jgi:hypothetical protein
MGYRTVFWRYGAAYPWVNAGAHPEGAADALRAQLAARGLDVQTVATVVFDVA